MKNRLKAFTIMEVTVAMLLASISIAIAFTAYTLISRSYFRFDERNQQMAEFLRADQLLKKDILASGKMAPTVEGIRLETSQGLIVYEFNQNYMIRDQFGIRKDTFLIGTRELVITFENEPAITSSLADELKFETELMKQPAVLRYKKSYSAEELMNGLVESGKYEIENRKLSRK